MKEFTQNLLALVVAAGLLWFWWQPSKRDIEQWVQKAFLEVCEENDFDVKAEDIDEISLVSERWLKKYVGFFTLKAKASEKRVLIPVSALIEFSKFTLQRGEDLEYQMVFEVAPEGVERLESYTKKPYTDEKYWDF